MGIERPHVLKTFDQLEMIGYVEPRHQDELLHAWVFGAIGDEIQDQRPGLIEKCRNDVDMGDNQNFPGTAGGFPRHPRFDQRARPLVEGSSKQRLYRTQQGLRLGSVSECLTTLGVPPDLDQHIEVRWTDLRTDTEADRALVLPEGPQLLEGSPADLFERQLEF